MAQVEAEIKSQSVIAVRPVLNLRSQEMNPWIASWGAPVVLAKATTASPELGSLAPAFSNPTTKGITAATTNLVHKGTMMTLPRSRPKQNLTPSDPPFSV